MIEIEGVFRILCWNGDDVMNFSCLHSGVGSKYPCGCRECS